MMNEKHHTPPTARARGEYEALRYPGDLALDIGVGARRRLPWRALVIGGGAAMAAVVVLGSLTVGAIVWRALHRPAWSVPGGALMPTAVSLSLPSTGSLSPASAASLPEISLSMDGLPAVWGVAVNLASPLGRDPGAATRKPNHPGGPTATTKERTL